MSEYSVKVKAVLDVSDVQKQLQNLGKNTKLNVGGKGVKGATNQIGALGNATQKAGQQVTQGIGTMNKQFKGLKGIATQFGDITRKVALFGASTNLMNAASQGVQAMVGSVANLDASLTELKKVSDLNGKSLENFTDKAFAAGQEVAKTG